MGEYALGWRAAMLAAAAYVDLARVDPEQAAQDLRAMAEKPREELASRTAETVVASPSIYPITRNGVVLPCTQAKNGTCAWAAPDEPDMACVPLLVLEALSTGLVPLHQHDGQALVDLGWAVASPSQRSIYTGTQALQDWLDATFPYRFSR